MNFTNKQRYYLLFASGILFGLSWITYGFSLFIAFVPLLFLEDFFSEHQNEYKSGVMFRFSYVIFVIWHSLTVWWIGYASVAGLIMAVLLNSLFYTFVVWLFHLSKRKVGANAGYAILVVLWLALEYIHTFWELSWPWMNLGNWLARDIKLIQWYEYTGVRGGSLWIILVNLLIFAILKYALTKSNLRNLILSSFAFLFLIFIPVIISVKMFNNYKEKQNPVDVVVFQPNIDPYNEKYDYSKRAYQLRNMIELSDSLSDDKVDYIVGPETAFPRGDWESHLKQNGTVLALRRFLQKYPQAKMIVGLSSYKRYPKSDQKPTPTAVKLKGRDKVYYDRYNSAVQIDTSGNLPIYHKSKFVLGVEKMPFLSYIPALEKLAMDFGGIVGSLGSDKERTVFVNDRKNVRVGVMICYESVYGEFVTEYIKKGANLLFVITNDGWWEDTPGHLQHLAFAQIRAIETRRSIARSANTGVSAFINQRGELQQATQYWVRDVIRQKINASQKITFFVSHGDIIGRISLFLSILMLIYTLVKYLLPKEQLVFKQ